MGLDNIQSKVWKNYYTHYKKWMIIPIVLITIALAINIFQFASTGSPFDKDVSLNGGKAITIASEQPINAAQLQSALSSAYPSNDVEVKEFGGIGLQGGVQIEIDLLSNDEQDIQQLFNTIASNIGTTQDQLDIAMESFGPSLSSSFFREAAFALLFAFLLMALVIFIYFRLLVPSVAIVIAALFDMLVALAFVNLFDIKLGTSGIAAFLMLIGYAVDTNILLSIRTLKRREGTVEDRIKSSISTGLTQTFTSLIAVSIALLITQSEVVSQIMLILFVGLMADLVFTWIQNVGFIRLYLERKHHG